MAQPKTTITKLDLLHAPSGHPQRFCGTGAHRDDRKAPKGGRKHQARKAIREWQ